MRLNSITMRVNSDTISAGNVISQNPAAGASVVSACVFDAQRTMPPLKLATEDK
jgi:hypothetical protein